MAKYKELRTMYMDDLRNLCIRNSWYTHGDCDEYDTLLHMCCNGKKNITTDDIVEMANNILEHSVTEHYFESVCFELFRICNTHIVEA